MSSLGTIECLTLRIKNQSTRDHFDKSKYTYGPIAYFFVTLCYILVTPFFGISNTLIGPECLKIILRTSESPSFIVKITQSFTITIILKKRRTTRVIPMLFYLAPRISNLTHNNSLELVFLKNYHVNGAW